MGYEKKYKEALDLARDYYKADKILANCEEIGVLEDIFHELKESEDENIKQWLIGYFQQYKKDGMGKYANGLKVDDILAWLEKQGEQKLVFAWSEEDDRMLKHIIGYLHSGDDFQTGIDWLKSLKERIGG